MATTTNPAGIDIAQMTRAQRAALPISAEVARALAEQHGVCIRPLAMRRIDTTTGRIEVVPVPCGSTREDQCRPCADKARRLRMTQCRQGWHLEHEPVTSRAAPTQDHTALMATRADLLAVYAECKVIGDEITGEQITDSIAEFEKTLLTPSRFDRYLGGDRAGSFVGERARGRPGPGLAVDQGWCGWIRRRRRARRARRG